MSIGRQERFTAQSAADREAGVPPPAPAPDRPPIGGEPLTAPPNTIGCCICLNQQRKRLAATTVVSGYAVCDEHVELAGAPGFSIHKIRGDQHTT